MAITIYGRGFPLRIQSDGLGTMLSASLNGGGAFGVTSAGVISAVGFSGNIYSTTFTGTTVSATNVYATTISATTVSAANAYVTQVTGTTVSATNVYITTLSGTTVSSTNAYVTTLSGTTVSATNVQATTLTGTYLSGAGGYFTLTSLPSATVIKLSSGSTSTTPLCAPAYLLFTDASSHAFYIPAFTTCGGSA